MIDLEPIVIDRVNTTVKGVYPNAVVYGSFQPIPSKFPCVMVCETGNTTVPELLFEDRVERFSDVTYGIQIYTTGDTKKSQANQILIAIDEALRRLVTNSRGSAAGLIRSGKSYVFNINESEVCCLTATYFGRVGLSPSGDKYTIYRR